MDTEVKNDQSDLLKKAKTELKNCGVTNVICPKCRTSPKMNMKGNRRIISCECRFLFDGEIFF